ncbi:MAG: SufE family protein [Chthonomonas sp.]|nr:SufE family protein [Chthonomonas sp.]
MTGLPPRLQDVVDTLALFDDRSEKIQAIISIAESYSAPSHPKPYPVESRVPGCESEVYVWGRHFEGGWSFEFAVDNPQGLSAMAFAKILQDGLNGLTSDEIRQVPDDLVYEVFGRELSMGKSMGLINMLQMCKRIAA